jgi:hypothetical protein
MKLRSIVPLIVLLLAPSLLFAQGKSASLILEFVDGSELTIVTPTGVTLSYPSGVAEEDSIPVGSLVKTGPSTSAELRLSPNGSLIKLARGTSFRVDAVAKTVKETNSFALLGGKVRAVAAKGATYEIRSTSTVAGVRGTDFTFVVMEGSKNLLMVAKGAVQFARLASDGSVMDSILVGAGEFADLFGPAFQPQAFTPEQYDAEYSDVAIDPAKVQSVPDVAPQDEAAEGDTKAKDAGKSASSTEGNPFVTWLKETLGFEIGSVTINQTTYSKAVIQPVFKLGKLKMGLYLPIIYTSNLFDSSDWYHPAGNDEWSFGTDVGWRDNTGEAAIDALQDLALKIRFIEYGKQLEDPFYLKVGNLNDMTIGHGLIMRNFANDADFPAIRHVGLNMGVTGKRAGFEVVADDLADPSVVGGRIFFFPLSSFPFSVGLQGVADLYPARELSDPDSVGDPIFLAMGLDLDLPIIRNNDLLGLRWFAEGAAMLPYTRTAIGTVNSGFQTQLLWSDGQLKNWGASSGFMGNVTFIDWRLEFRYYTGAFKPAFFDSSYERNSGSYASEYANYLDGTTDYDSTAQVMGIYGEGGFTFMNEKLSLTLGYFWPWSPDATSWADQVAKDDYLEVKLIVKKGLIPVLDIYGSVSYEKTGLARDLFYDGSFSFFDATTTLKGEIVLPVPKTPNLDIAFVFSTSAERDVNGNVVYKADNVTPEIVPTITLETRLHL